MVKLINKTNILALIINYIFVITQCSGPFRPSRPGAKKGPPTVVEVESFLSRPLGDRSLSPFPRGACVVIHVLSKRSDLMLEKSR